MEEPSVLSFQSGDSSAFERSQFVCEEAKIFVDVETKNAKKTAIDVMQDLKSNRHDFYEIHARGKLNC